ncbi:MAG: GAF domain-containing protein, partial [Blastocatellia bacterium]
WYDSACLWLIETHQDRGELLLPGPSVRFPEAKNLRDGIPSNTDFLGSREMIVLRSLKYLPEEYEDMQPRFRHDIDAPAAFIPLRKDRNRSGVLALYGKQGGPANRRHNAFLQSLGSIISNTMEQWEGRYNLYPQREIDQLSKCDSLEEVFPKAAKILKAYLEAEACLIIFRPDPNGTTMEVSATEGLRSIKKGLFQVGQGQAGKCANLGKVLRWDEVPKHLDEFDTEMLDSLEKALGHRIISWMAIPIGSQRNNHGVILMLNSQYRCHWFTDEDERRGKALARQLHPIIEKFLHTEQIEAQRLSHMKQLELESEKAEQSATLARAAQTVAETIALQRQDDLMIITHQLQGPLNSVIGAITRLQRKTTQKDFLERLERVQALVEDCLALCWGTFTTFGDDAGRKPSFGADNIDAPKELNDLCMRLQKTNARTDLKFIYDQDMGFPTLRMDRNVFTSVFYSLIHNAMKYADEGSKVFLLCTFERATGEAALKVKSVGEPILPAEKELIFEKYRRGSVIEDTGRHHSGVGLGLWVARKLMRAINGDLDVELSAEHPELSVFIVRVPPANDSTPEPSVKDH